MTRFSILPLIVAAELMTPEMTAMAHDADISTEVSCTKAMDGLTLSIKDCDGMPNETRRLLWQTIAGERGKLEDLLGSDALGQYGNIPVDIVLHPENPGDGRVYWYGGTHTKPGENVHCETIQKGELVLGSLKEPLVAHELVHLLVQPPCTTSQAAYEGHAHAITSLLYPDKAEPTDVTSRLDDKGYRPLWRQGWDFNNLTVSIRPVLTAPIPNKGFETILEYKWARLWKEWENENPGFFQKFYTQIGILKKQGVIEIGKDEIIALAESITPGFSQWVKKKAHPLMDLGSDGSHEVARAITVGTETDIVQYCMEQVETTHFTTPYWVVKPCTTGLVTAWTPQASDPYEQPHIVTYIDPAQPEKFFMIVPETDEKHIVRWQIGKTKLYY